MVTFNAHFDGKVFVPDEPPLLAPNQKVRISVEPIEATTHSGRREFGQQKGVVEYVAPDFDDYLGDDFWGLSGKKQK